MTLRILAEVMVEAERRTVYGDMTGRPLGTSYMREVLDRSPQWATMVRAAHAESFEPAPLDRIHQPDTLDAVQSRWPEGQPGPDASWLEILAYYHRTLPELEQW